MEEWMHEQKFRRGARHVLATSMTLALTASLLFTTPGAHAAQMALRVDAGGYHTCAVRSGGGATCWGYNSDGQAKGKAGPGFRTVSSGGLHSCGLKKDHSVKCWGFNGSGQAPGSVSGSFASISAGGSHTCGVKLDDSIACWGDDSYGQAPSSVSGSFTSVSAGEVHTCAVKADQTIACWGWNDRGQAPPTVAGSFLSVSAGGAHTCAVRSDHTVQCWGADRYGQATPPGVRFSSVSAGNTHTCGVRMTGALACWGLNSYGEAPPDVAGSFLSVSAGDAHTCAVTANHLARCWGDNSSHQLGAAPAVPSPAPPSGAPGVAYDASFTSSAGRPVGAFKVTAGNLPPGLTMSPAGRISGTPTAGGTYTFTVEASNIFGAKTAVFSITTGTSYADLRLAQTAPATAPIGSPFATAITVHNAGPTTTGGTLHLTTAQPVKLVKLEPPAGVSCIKTLGMTLSAACSFSGGTALADGDDLSVTVRLASGEAQQVTVEASVQTAGSVIDPTPSNDDSSSTTEAVAQQGTTYTWVADGGFQTDRLSVPAGRTIFWNNEGPGAHSVDDATGLGLFSLIGKEPVSFGSYRFFAAGLYQVKDGARSQTVRVRIKRSDIEGTTSSTFTLTWGTRLAPIGYHYVVSIHRPGTPWAAWKHTRIGSGQFTPDAGTGTYWFRSRLKRLSDDVSTDWVRTSISIT